MKKKILITGATSGIGLNFFKKNLFKNYEFLLIGRNFSNIDNFLFNKKISRSSSISIWLICDCFEITTAYSVAKSVSGNPIKNKKSNFFMEWMQIGYASKSYSIKNFHLK